MTHPVIIKTTGSLNIGEIISLLHMASDQATESPQWLAFQQDHMGRYLI